MRTRSVLTLALGAFATLSCHRRNCQDPAPQPQCYSGVIFGDACLDGVLIEVDAATPIGTAAGNWGTNVVAAVNFADFGSLYRVGQRVYFTYRNDPNQQFAIRACTANTVRLPVPHLLLGNISATGCGSTAAPR